MKRTKYSNAILDNPKNGGIHSTRRLKSVQTLLTTHDLKKAVMYEFILSGKVDKADYQATIKALVRHIRTECRAEYIGAYEVGNEKGGLHCHCYFIIECADQIPRYLLDVSAGHWIARRVKRTGMSIKIAPPQNTMHGGAMFARMDTPAKLEDCIAWCSYHVKTRSKDGVPGREIYFASEFASNTGKREAQRQKHRDALMKSSRPVAPVTNPSPPVDCSTGKDDQDSLTDKEQQHESNTPAVRQARPVEAGSTNPESPSSGPYSLSSSSSGPILVSTRSGMLRGPYANSSSPEGEAINARRRDGSGDGPTSEIDSSITQTAPGDAMTPAERYIASKYEEAIDLGLDLAAMRRYLLDNGIPRTPGQVVFDLDERYGFHGYASGHPAPAQRTYAEIDAELGREERKPSRTNRVELVNVETGVYNCLTDVRQSYTPRPTI